MRRGSGKKVCFLLLVILATVFLCSCQRTKKEQKPDDEAGATSVTAEIQETTDELERLLWNKIRLDGKKYRYSTDYETYLLMGTDESGTESTDREKYIGNMADFLMLVIVNRTDKTYAFLPLNRDTMTEIALIDQDGEGEATAVMQLCTAHWYGGSRKESCENTVKAVSGLLGGIVINGYYEIHMQDIGKLNETVEGVTVTIESDFSKVDPSLKQGETITLNGEQAYHFLQNRTEVDDGGNVSRMKRQKQYMEAFFKKVKQKMEQDPQIMLTIYDEMADVAFTDLSGGMLSDLVVALQDGKNLGFQELTGENRIGSHLDDGLEHMEFYSDADSVKETLQALYHITE